MKKGDNKTATQTANERTPYENLLNAIIAQAVYDYEALISDAPINELNTSYYASTMTTAAIRAWAKDTRVEKILDKIDKVYEEEFKPYAKEHAVEIVKEWKRIQRIRDEWERELAVKASPYKCPLCGGSLKPKKINGLQTITCNYCYLNVKMPKGVKV